MSAAEDVARLEAELEALEAEAVALHARIQRDEGRVAELRGTWAKGGGLIGKARVRLAEAKRLREDADLPVAVWIRQPTWRDDNYVISKVTPKQIHIRRVGGRTASIYSRASGQEGRRTSIYGAKLDVDACLAAWGEYRRQAK